MQGSVTAKKQTAPSGLATALFSLLSAIKKWKYPDFYMRKLWRYLPDKMFVSLQYLEVYGCFPDLNPPRTFDEKLQWYKLYYRNPLMTDLADKYKVREYVARKGFGGLLNELIGVYDRAEAIDSAALPDSFVLKATHGSAMNIICKDKAQLNWKATCALMRNWLRTDYSSFGREWAYKNIRPRLICEKYLENSEFKELVDYKFYCYSGRPEVAFICTGRYSAAGLKYYVYDMDWNSIDVSEGRDSSKLPIDKPDNWNLMIEVARALSQGFPFIRVDLYSIQGKVIFGELTFYPDNGLCAFTPGEYSFSFDEPFILPPRMTAKFLRSD